MSKLYPNLLQVDPELHDLLCQEELRQQNGLELIASENFTSKPVLECLGSCLTNKYSEGLPNQRYYGGNQIIDKIELLCQKRALEAYNLDPNEWGVNVQPYSGSIANLAAYNSILEPGDKLMGLDLPSGGHLTHGFQTPKRKVSITSKIYQSKGYTINEQGYIDYDKLENEAREFKPKLIICGASAYPRDLDYKRFRKIADINGSYLLCDMAHISGLVATGEHNNPFEYCDLVTSTTHKTLRGPRSGMIFYKKHLEKQVNNSVFPGIQGGPHDHQIGALCVQLLEVKTPEFKSYIQQVKKNAKKLAEELINRGYSLSTDGTDNHLILMNVREKGVTGSKVEKLCEMVDISLNKNSIYGDKSAMNPGGVRIGTPCVTTRGFKEEDMVKLAELLDRTICLCLKIQEKSGKKLVDFVGRLSEFKEEINDIKEEVNNL